MDGAIHSIPLSDCRGRLIIADQHPQTLDYAQGLALTIPCPPAPWPCQYTLLLPACKGFPSHPRWSPSGIGIDDLSLRPSVGATPDKPLHFFVDGGRVWFLADSTLILE